MRAIIHFTSGKTKNISGDAVKEMLERATDQKLRSDQIFTSEMESGNHIVFNMRNISHIEIMPEGSK